MRGNTWVLVLAASLLLLGCGGEDDGCTSDKDCPSDKPYCVGNNRCSATCWTDDDCDYYKGPHCIYGACSWENLPPPSGLSCMEIVSCVGTCADTDGACMNACAARGSSLGKLQWEALLSCWVNGPTTVCGDYCGPGTPAACDHCLKVKCVNNMPCY